MDLDGVLGVVGLLLYWRAVLCLLISIVGAFLLVHLLPWFTGLQGLVFAVLGLLPGLIWEEAARSSPTAPASPSTSTSVGVLAAVVFGTVWGAVSSTSVHSAIAGVAVLALAAWAWFYYAVVSKLWLSREQGILCTVAAVVAYPIAAVIAHSAA
jgi:hypothetical protein